MDGLLLGGECVQACEDGVDVARVRAEIEDGLEIDAARDLVVGADELAEVELLVPRAHGIALHEPVRVVALESRLDEREQNTLAEEERVTRLDIASHSFRSHHET